MHKLVVLWTPKNLDRNFFLLKHTQSVIAYVHVCMHACMHACSAKNNGRGPSSRDPRVNIIYSMYFSTRISNYFSSHSSQSRVLWRSFVSYVQGQSPTPKTREYFYFIDHQGQVSIVSRGRLESGSRD